MSSDIVARLRDDTRHVLWSQDRVRLYAADYIERLEAALKAADKMRAAVIGGAGGLKRIQTANAYDTARARVNLSTTSNGSPSSQAALDNSVSDGHAEQTKPKADS